MKPKLDTLTPEQKRTVIAESMGCKRYARPWDGRVFLCQAKPAEKWKTTKAPADVVNSDIPNYLQDRNAMAEAVASLSGSEMHAYAVALANMFWPLGWRSWPDTLAVSEATAEQRCNAYLIAKGLAV